MKASMKEFQPRDLNKITPEEWWRAGNKNYPVELGASIYEEKKHKIMMRKKLRNQYQRKGVPGVGHEWNDESTKIITRSQRIKKDKGQSKEKFEKQASQLEFREDYG